MSRRRRNREYWSERFEYLQNQLLKKGDDYYKSLANAYEKALVSIERDISYFYYQFAQDNKVSYAEAKQALNSRERRRFQMGLDDYIERGRTLNYSKRWDRRLNNASTAHRISRLESLQIQMGQQIEELHIRFNTEMSDLAREIITEGQLKSTYELQIGMEEGRAFELLDTRTVESIVSKPWTKDDRTFSDRIWRNKDKLVNTLENKLEVAFIRGDPPGKLIKEIMQEFDTSKFNASRLVQTESAYFSSVTTLKSYEDMEIEKFIIIATLDEITSEICQDLDGKVFKVSDYRIGDTAPPFHPFCRTTTAPYSGEDSVERVARDKNGEIYYVDGNLTYKDWREKFVEYTHRIPTDDKAENADNFFGKIRGIFNSNQDNIKILEEFNEQLNNVQNVKVRRLLKNAKQEAKITFDPSKASSHHSKGKVTLGTRATASTVAHELFHYIDFKKDISTRKSFKGAINADYKKIRRDTDGIYISVKDMLHSKYPYAFTRNGKLVTLKEDYRGISDILNGITKGEETFGYGHRPSYWSKSGTLEKETWAQFGRIFYDDNEEVINMAKELFGNTFSEVESILKELK